MNKIKSTCYSRTPVNNSTGLLSGIPSSGRISDGSYWRWGDDNMLPYSLALMARRSTIHRRILNDKADYISGKGFTWDEGLTQLGDFAECANGFGESLREVINKLAFDKLLFGNAFLEVITDEQHSFVSLFHQDASRVRVSRSSDHVILHHNWAAYTPSDAKTLPIFPLYEKGDDGLLHSLVRYADYEPMYTHYGIPDYIAGLGVSAIVYKTDKWNVSRLDNSFQLSGVMMLDGGVDNEQQADEIARLAERKFGGRPGQVMFMIRDSGEGDNSRFIPIQSDNDGDWRDLHDQATSDIVIAHSWYRALSGLDFSSGFSSERIHQEYELALNTVILSEQAEIMEPVWTLLESVLHYDCSSLRIVNHPPTSLRPDYMKVWEARKSEGLDYDPSDPAQNIFLAELGSKKQS